MKTQGKHILLIEDDHALGESTAEILRLGHSVEWVLTADDAFKALSRHQFDVAIVDLQLGLDNAVTLVKALQRFGKPLPPLIIFSAQPIAMIRDAVAETGAVMALQKPCSASVIQEAIDFVVQRPDKDETTSPNQHAV